MKNDSRFNDLRKAIHFQNEFNRVAAPIVEYFKTISKPFVGKKIDTLNGFTAKFREANKFDRESVVLKPMAGQKWAKLHGVYLESKYNSLTIEISLAFSVSSTSCEYHKQTFWIGEVKDQVLTSIDENCKVSDTVLNFDEEVKKIKTFKELEAKAEAAEELINVGKETYKYISLDDF